MSIRPPRNSPDHEDHIIDCEGALEDAIAAIEREAEEAGWSEDVIGCALINLGRNRILAARANRETQNAIVNAQRRQ